MQARKVQIIHYNAQSDYHKCFKFLTPKKFAVSAIQREMPPKDADRMANREDLEQTAPPGTEIYAALSAYLCLETYGYGM